VWCRLHSPAFAVDGLQSVDAAPAWLVAQRLGHERPRPLPHAPHHRRHYYCASEHPNCPCQAALKPCLHQSCFHHRSTYLHPHLLLPWLPQLLHLQPLAMAVAVATECLDDGTLLPPPQLSVTQHEPIPAEVRC
jgi:hypothetical protein